MDTRERISHLKPLWARRAHPVYWLETERRKRAGLLTGLRLGCLPAIFLLSGLALWVVFIPVINDYVSWGWDPYYAVTTSLGWALLSMLTIQFGVGAASNLLMIAQTAPMLSSEIELQSWDLLRTTSLLLREIVLAKFAAAIRQLRVPLIGLMLLRGISTITGLLLLFYTLFWDTFYYFDQDDWWRFWKDVPVYAVPILLPSLLFLVYYVNQPVIQTFFNGALGLLASSYARTRRRAIVAGLIGRLALWISSILLNIGALYGGGYLIAQWTEWTYDTTGRHPSSELNTWIVGMAIALLIALILASQAGFVLLAFGLTQRRARRGGG